MTINIEELQNPLHEPSLFRSDLEGLLLQTTFPSDILLRAAHFRRNLVLAGLTRCGRRETIWRRPVGHDQVILVLGQADNNATLRLDGANLHCNAVLLQAVCQAHADAYIVYKPHPEVWARIQTQGHTDFKLLQWCNECAGDVPLSQLLPKVNEVHVMNSLAGFEALMLGKKISCYAQSFYSGWGLTTDKVRMVPRARQISLDELVAGAMFSYPRYMSRLAGRIAHLNTAQTPTDINQKDLPSLPASTT